MKIAIVYNRESQAVINLFGTLNREKYGLDTIKSIKDALEAGGHQVRTFEGDKNIISRLEKFMPTVISGERPGLVFNLSYGIQGKGRYMHIPGILEMLGIPYVGSSPESHAIALDKVITKMILIQKGLPTPLFAVMDKPDSPIDRELKYPLIVKPKNEAVSFGLRIVYNEEELREGVAVIYDSFQSPTLVEEYIEGREINVGLLGNADTLEALPPVELVFGDGPQIYTYEDKTSASGRTVGKVCPAALTEEQTRTVKQLAKDTFNALGCYDSARVDFRLDSQGRFYILEVNSMASLGANASFVYAAEKAGLDFTKLINRLIDVTCERYFGPMVSESFHEGASQEAINIFHTVTRKRDQIEEDLRAWTNMPSWTEDAVGISTVVRSLEDRMKKLGMQENQRLSNGRSAWTYETRAGLEGGILLAVPIDIPGHRAGFPIPFRTEEEWLFGEGIGSSRGGLVTLLWALGALKESKALAKRKIGVFFYADEGRGMRYSSSTFVKASREASQVLVLMPGFEGGKVVDQRRGTKKYSVVVEGDPVRIGSHKQKVDVLSSFIDRAEKLRGLSVEKDRITVAVQDVKSERYSVLLPHRVASTVYISYLDEQKAQLAEQEMKKIFRTNTRGMKCSVEKLEERPALRKVRRHPIVRKLERICGDWNLPFGTESSLLASAAGEVSQTPALCGLGPACQGMYTPHEAIHRGELVERTLLLAVFLLQE